MKLPDNYRIQESCYGGSGRGDERFGLVLQAYETREVKRFLRKPRQVTGWWNIEHRERQTPEDEAFLHQTASLRSKGGNLAY